jgi:uncharacterized protein (TIGR02145 family)
MRFSLLIVFTVLHLFANAQAPALIPYQAIARNAAGEPLASSTLNARFTIHDGTATGTNVWQELQTVSTTALGLFTVQLGSSVALSSVNWANGAKFMQVEIDLGQGFVDIGTQQLLSVPYALHSSSASTALSAGDGISNVSLTGDTLFLNNGSFVIIPGISVANNSGGGGSTGTTAHSCGAQNVHNASLTYGSVTDQQGNVYKTIVIGTQEWMAENLNTSIYRNGDAIPSGLSNADWENTINTQQGAWAYYNNDASNACPYGKLYNWYTCVDLRQLCPVGWHVPTDLDWSVMINFLDPLANGGANILNSAGGKMKTAGTMEDATGLWYSPNTGATNSSGFSGAPGGLRGFDGDYILVGEYGFWWSSSYGDAYFATDRILGYLNVDVGWFNAEKQDGFSVRCLRD